LHTCRAAHTIQSQNVKTASKSTNDNNFEAVLEFGFIWYIIVYECAKDGNFGQFEINFLQSRYCWYRSSKAACDHNTNHKTHNSTNMSRRRPTPHWLCPLPPCEGQQRPQHMALPLPVGPYQSRGIRLLLPWIAPLLGPMNSSTLKK